MGKKSVNLLVTVSGTDRPGITSGLVKIIAKAQVPIVDLAQSVTHGLLSLSIMMEMNEAGQGAQEIQGGPVNLLKDLLFEAKRLDCRLDFQILDSSNDKAPVWVDLGEKFVLSCVANDSLTATFLSELSFLLADHGINITKIDNVTNANKGAFRCIEMLASCPPGVRLEALKGELMQIGSNHQTDLAFFKESIYRGNKRIIVFDMDSTLVESEVIDELAELKGVGELVKEITKRAMNGEINFDQSLRERVALLKGLGIEQVEEVRKNLRFTPGTPEFVAKLKKLGLKMAVISGGFRQMTDSVKRDLGLDYSFANELEIEDGKLTGRLRGQIVNAEQKAFLLELIAQQENVPLDQVVAIGDGANDLPMLAKAGIGIAYHAKDLVKQTAKNHLSFGPMTSILYFLGITD